MTRDLLISPELLPYSNQTFGHMDSTREEINSAFWWLIGSSLLFIELFTSFNFFYLDAY